MAWCFCGLCFFLACSFFLSWPLGAYYASVSCMVLPGWPGSQLHPEAIWPLCCVPSSWHKITEWKELTGSPYSILRACFRTWEQENLSHLCSCSNSLFSPPRDSVQGLGRPPERNAPHSIAFWGRHTFEKNSLLEFKHRLPSSTSVLGSCSS